MRDKYSDEPDITLLPSHVFTTLRESIKIGFMKRLTKSATSIWANSICPRLTDIFDSKLLGWCVFFYLGNKYLSALSSTKTSLSRFSQRLISRCRPTLVMALLGIVFTSDFYTDISEEHKLDYLVCYYTEQWLQIIYEPSEITVSKYGQGRASNGSRPGQLAIFVSTLSQNLQNLELLSQSKSTPSINNLSNWLQRQPSQPTTEVLEALLQHTEILIEVLLKTSLFLDSAAQSVNCSIESSSFLSFIQPLQSSSPSVDYQPPHHPANPDDCSFKPEEDSD